MRPSERRDPMNRPWAVPLVIVAPLVAAVGFVAAVTLGGAAGMGPFRPDPPRNVAEALALSDSATAVRMFRDGADPAAMYDIRPGMLASDAGTRVRPLSAAAYTSDDDMVRLAQRFGATLPPDDARPVACWLFMKGREKVARMVAPQDWAADGCPPLEDSK